MDRRQFLKTGLGLGVAAGSMLLPAGFMDQAQAAEVGFDLTQGSRVLKLYRPKTKETLHLEYLRNGVWQNSAYNHICWLLRDVQANQHVRMDTRLIAIMDWTQHFLAQYGYDGPLHILSGYRSPQTNSRIEGAAKNSQHMYGRAIDIRIPGISTEYLGRLYGWLSQGGVGVYHDDGFVHVDTGRIRAWRG